MVRNPHGRQFQAVYHKGSVLGPILFLIFINDLDSTLTSFILKFADDTKLFGRVNTDMDREVLQRDLYQLLKWSKKWQMQFNTGKCVVVHFGYSNKQFDYYMDNQKFDVVKEAKDLGITISCTLKPATECQQAYAKASRALMGLIARTISYKSPEVLLKLYKTLVRPQYCVSAWSPYYVKDKALLERIQHRFTRMVPELKSLPYEERLDRLGIWTLEEPCRFTTGVQALQGMVIYSIWSLFHNQYCYEHSRPYCKD